MHEVLAAEQAAMAAIATSQRRADDLVQTARARARRIAERARARVAGLERANHSSAKPLPDGSDVPLEIGDPSAEDLARLEAALQRLVDDMLEAGDGGTQF